MDLPKVDYNYEAFKLTKIFENEKVKTFPNQGVETKESIDVFGHLKFPEYPDRIYLTASFVSSIDGKIAYLDDPAGPVIARANQLDPDGATADFWLLNLFRASADAIFVGAGTMHKEGPGTAHIFDQNLEDKRVELGMNPIPYAVICSLDGDIPFDDYMLTEQPCMINTSPEGLKVVEKGIQQEYYVVGPYHTMEEIEEEKIRENFKKYDGKKIPVIVTGDGEMTNSHILLRVLKLMGLNKAIVESPSYCHSLMQDKLLDEILLNYSCVYIGGEATSFGKGMEAFTSKAHPHTEMLSIHMHSPNFFYFRHKFNYDFM